MTVREEVQQLIEQDPELIRLRKKIESGKATYADTAAYSNRAGKLLGEVFSRRLPEIPLEEREPLCVELLHDRYIDINAAIDTAQRYMDDALGIHIAPQHAPFDSERGHQIGSSLRDLSKPVETLQRRAKAAPETATKAMHDDRMKAESKFRHRAGLDCRITRVAVNGCCPWCSKVAGRYRYGEEPDDIYRRHDNCDCTVTFENGRKRQDVWSKREWEVPGKDAGADDKVVLTAEQVEALQKKKQLMRLTDSPNSGMITIDIDRLTPCLIDNKTGEIVETEVRRVTDYSSLSKCTKNNGWDFTWSRPPAGSEVYSLHVKGCSDIEGLIAIKPEPKAQAVYMFWGNAAPHNQKTKDNPEKKYDGVGGHLFAIAAKRSVEEGYGGFIYAEAAEEKLFNLFVNEYGALPLPAGYNANKYRFALEGESVRRILNTYSFDWSD